MKNIHHVYLQPNKFTFILSWATLDELDKGFAWAELKIAQLGA
jgi:hypothetical protein